MNVSTKGIVLRKVKYGESSLIVDILTEAQGKQTYIVNGVRSSRSKAKASLLNLGTILHLEAYHKPTSKINRIREFDLAVSFQRIPFDFVRGNIALFMCELLSRSIRGEEANSPLYEFAESCLCYLDGTEHIPANLHLVFVVRLADFLGIGIADSYDEDVPFFDIQSGEFVPKHERLPYCLDEHTSRCISLLNEVAMENCQSIRLNHLQRNEIVQGLLQYYYWHIEGMGEVRSFAILRDVFA